MILIITYEMNTIIHIYNMINLQHKEFKAFSTGVTNQLMSRLSRRKRNKPHVYIMLGLIMCLQL